GVRLVREAKSDQRASGTLRAVDQRAGRERTSRHLVGALDFIEHLVQQLVGDCDCYPLAGGDVEDRTLLDAVAGLPEQGGMGDDLDPVGWPGRSVLAWASLLDVDRDRPPVAHVDPVDDRDES